ncbi:Squamosa promoter-binding-like protein [Musa troglodytarum]|uniref:Squamosa promoter-binding-like protein n=1 Tax=Musa troglodytarum TaxID=320322 RepID=A0A9E7L2U3_9LILI|nr:Squamosa promoter-binding-like protein [Musa troglodytarum]
MDSSSLKASAASSSSSDPPHGLKFGQKIYFDGGSGGSGSSSETPSAPATEAATPPPPTKKGKGLAQGGQHQPPRCQVEGCNVDLTGAKAYYCRHKVCGMHSKAPKVVVAGLEQRFCQQCSRFHQLPEFDQGKRSCRRRLAGHNERRRKPPPGPYGRFASSFQQPSGFRSLLMDFSYPNLSSSRRNPAATAGDRVATNEWHRGLDASPGEVAPHGTRRCSQGPAAGALCSTMEIPTGECLAGVADSSCALSLLSTHPWSSSSARNGAPVIPATSIFDGPRMVDSVIPSSYVTGLWGIRDHGGRTSPHKVLREMGSTEATATVDAHFSGQVEFALQENGQRLDHGSGSAYGHSGLHMHRSL